MATKKIASVLPHDPHWASEFLDEKRRLHALSLNGEFHHIGSTAVPGILAKPIIDILGVVDDLSGVDLHSAAFAALGYEVMGEFGIGGRRYFRKTNASGIRTHHLHIFDRGSQHVERHLAFRDYLIAHPTVAETYSALKASLTDAGVTHWDAYMDGKDPFIKMTEPQAVAWFRKCTSA